MAGKHKKRQSLDLHSLSVQVQQQHPLHSHMCKPIDAPSSFKVLLVRSIVVNPRNERLETQNTKGFKKRRQEVYSNLSIIINNKNNTRISKTLISEKTLFINKMQSPKRIEKTSEFGWGEKRAEKKKKKMMMQGRTAKDEEASNSHTYVLRASSTTTTPIAFILRNANPDT